MLEYVLDNPIMAAIIVVSGAVVIYFILKKLLKYALIAFVVFVALACFSWYRAPEEFPDRFRSNLEEMHERSGQAVERGKGALERGQGFISFIDRVMGRETSDSDRD